MYVFQCEDAPDGIWTAIYDAYSSRLGHENIRLSCQNDTTRELFCTSRTIFTDPRKSRAIRHTLQKHFSPADYTTLCEAALSVDAFPDLPIDKAEAIYKTVVLGLLHTPEETELARHAAEPHVCKVFALSRRTRTETYRLLASLSFQNTKSGLLLAEIAPQNQVLPLLAEAVSHERPFEDFLIYDITHHQAVFHACGYHALPLTPASDLLHP